MPSKKTPTATAWATEAQQMTWYSCGQMMPADVIDDDLGIEALVRVKAAVPTLIPTTYEAAEVYLREESSKPTGEQNLLREMCVMIPLGLPEDRSVSFAVPLLKTKLALRDGTVIVLPTTEVAPDTFGTPENMGLLDSKLLMYDPPTNTPQKGTILLSYFTKSGPDVIDTA